MAGEADDIYARLKAEVAEIEKMVARHGGAERMSIQMPLLEARELLAGFASRDAEIERKGKIFDDMQAGYHGILEGRDADVARLTAEIEALRAALTQISNLIYVPSAVYRISRVAIAAEPKP